MRLSLPGISPLPGQRVVVVIAVVVVVVVVVVATPCLIVSQQDNCMRHLQLGHRSTAHVPTPAVPLRVAPWCSPHQTCGACGNAALQPLRRLSVPRTAATLEPCPRRGCSSLLPRRSPPPQFIAARQPHPHRQAHHCTPTTQGSNAVCSSRWTRCGAEEGGGDELDGREREQ